MINQLLFLALLVLINAFFAASEIALISLNDNKIKIMAEQGNKKAQKLRKLLGEPSRFLATIQIGITLAGFLASAFASTGFAERIVFWLKEMQVAIPENIVRTGAVVVITLILSYFTLVFGELVPKRLAMKKAERIAFLAVTPLSLLLAIASPFVKLLTLSTNTVIRLCGIDPYADDEHITEEEIRMMVDVGQEKGAIDLSEKIMINNIFELDDKTVSDIMTHRTEIVGVPVTADLKEILRLVAEEKYTRLPVYEDNIDNIIGILHVKELVALLADCNKEDFILKHIIHRPYFIPAMKKNAELLKDMQLSKNHMAIVIDEYGGTAGIVTIEDLLEEIVGNIFDEYDTEEKEYEKLDENTYLLNGSLTLERVNEILQADLVSEDYDTLSGFLIGHLGRIPTKEETPVVEVSGLVFKVEKMDDKRISVVKACRI
ncbi:MAG: HlyC/CorC family transporter [Peptococcaceae bacterium]|nr:HlyC/CorC family transporter [Peptococcaceae bacterium]